MSEQITPGPWMRNGQSNLGWRIDGTTDRVGTDFLKNPVAIVPLAADADLIAAAPESWDLLEVAWGIIANASGGDWQLQTSEWQDAAARFRDNWQVLLNKVQS